MGTIKEALLRNGVFLYDGMTIENGFGTYMVVRDSSGIARYKIRNAELSNKLIVEDYYSGSTVRTIDFI
ncbi:hypothetical protein IJI76_00785 [Candidatus Saccharibacteria bacterium]|nr:hypothetical protein [Candidatus Saccharibacteria bacterium]